MVEVRAEYYIVLIVISDIFAVIFTSLVVLQLWIGCSAFYSAGDNVIDLNPSNFQQKVLQSDSVWLVEFYAPW